VVLRTTHQVAAEDLNVKGSALLHRRVRLDPNAAVLNIERRPGYVSLAVLRPRAGLLAKRAAREKESKAPMVNLADSRRAERRRQLTAARGSQSAERKSPKDQHLRQGHNNSGAILQRLRSKNFGAAFFLKHLFVGRLCQTPRYDLLVVGKTFLVWPLFPVSDQTSSNWIFSNVVPLFVN